MADFKKDVMKGHKEVEELYNAPKPSFIPTDEIWKKYVDHWCSPEMKARSAQNKRNRAKNAGRNNRCGRKGPVVRLLERERMGKPPSMAAVLLEMNQKKDEKGNPTGEYYNPPLQEALRGQIRYLLK